MFRRPARAAAQGDRAALLVTQLDPKLLERGLAAAPGAVPTFGGAVASVEKIRFYGGARRAGRGRAGRAGTYAQVMGSSQPAVYGGPRLLLPRARR